MAKAARESQRPRTTLVAKLLLILFGVVLALLMAGAAELALALAGYGPPRDLFLKVKPLDREEYHLNRRISELFFPRWATKPGFYERFPAVKDPGTIRIFATGASSTLGDPFGPQTAFPAILGDILRDVAPQKAVEVVNCGVIAISSLDVLEIQKKALRYEPDILLIYCGHNEAYGADGVDSPVQRSFSSRRLAKLWLKFRNLRIVLLAQNLLSRFRPAAGPGAEGFGMWLMRDHLVPHCSDKHERLLRFYRQNMLEMLADARRRGVDVILCTLVANVRDQSPMGSRHGCGLPQEDERRFRDPFERGVQAMERGDHGEALRFLRESNAIDPEYAEVHFRMGRCLEALGDSAAAFEEYLLARDLDAVHFRACGAQNEIVREIAAGWDTRGRHRLLLVDLERRLYTDFPLGPGRRFFTEHVHPYPIGHVWMAQAIARSLAASDLAREFGSWDLGSLRPPLEYLGRAGMTNLDVAAGLHLTDRFKLARWPFDQCYDNGEARTYIHERLRQLEAGMDAAQRTLYESLQSDATGRLYDFGTRHYVLADQCRAARRPADALRELLIARSYFFPMVFIENDLALLLAATGRLEQAEEALARARRLDPGYPALHFVAGTIHHGRGRPQLAAQEFQTYLRSEPHGRFSASARKALEVLGQAPRAQP